MTSKLLSVLSVLAAALLLTQRASAHTPFFPDRDISSPDKAWPVGDYSISWAFYARLAPAAAPQYYAIDGRAGTRLYVTLEVPVIAGLEEFRPSVAVIGPGLPAVAAPRGIRGPTGAGGSIANDDRTSPRPQFFEPFSRTRYYRGPQIDLSLPDDGRYYVVVFDATGSTGKYTLAIGTREVFGGGDPAWQQKLSDFFQEPGIDLSGEITARLAAALAALFFR